MLSRSEPREEIEIATNRITTMFLYFGKSEPQRSYKHGSYKKKKCILEAFLSFKPTLDLNLLKKKKSQGRKKDGDRQKTN